MTRLLHIDSSASAEGSVSKALAASFRKVWDAEQPDATVTYRDLGQDAVPHVDSDALASLVVPGEHQSERQREARVLHDTLIDELLGADALLISAPMYNWSIPSGLKAWIDQTIIFGRTLFSPAEQGPLAGRPVTVALAYGGGYSPGAPQAAWNHADTYLRTVFQEALGMELTVVTAQLTLAGKTPGMESLVEMAEGSLKAAHTDIEEAARKVSAGFALA